MDTNALLKYDPFQLSNQSQPITPLSQSLPPVKRMLQVMSWNLLSPQIASRMLYLYKHCVLENRFPRIIDRITKSQSLIICLQEVEEDQYETLKTILVDHHGFYIQRPQNPDGCATFLHKTCTIRHTEYLHLQDDSTLSDRGNVCLVHLIEYNSKPLIVCNTHILYNPRRGYIKAAQLVKIFSTVAQLMHTHQYSNAAVLCCGDFNLAPDSPLHEFICSGTLDWSRIDEHLLSHQMQKRRPSISLSQDMPTRIVHPFTFNSAYAQLESTHATQDLKHQGQFNGLFVDYIFYGHYNPHYVPLSPQHPYSDVLRCQVPPIQQPLTPITLQCETVKELPPPSECHVMPNRQEPSDHFDVQATFQIN